MTTVPVSTAQEPVQALVDQLWEETVEGSGEHLSQIEELQQTIHSLLAISEKLSSHLSKEAEQERKLEHDVTALRNRVAELEKSLQQRTEELLQAQAANNALAAELQQAEIKTEATTTSVSEENTPTAETVEESFEPNEESTVEAESPIGVSERFNRLRSSRSA